jgi:photosystem II stability/assembly factor-like uncharacterized protein
MFLMICLLLSGSLQAQYLIKISAEDMDSIIVSWHQKVGDEELAITHNLSQLDQKSRYYVILDKMLPVYSYYWIELLSSEDIDLKDVSAIPNGDLLWKLKNMAVLKCPEAVSLHNYLPAAFHYYQIDPFLPTIQTEPRPELSKRFFGQEHYQQIFDAVNIDSLMLTVKHLSGEESYTSDHGPDSILTRYTRCEGILKAQDYLKQKLERYGYQVELEEFNFTKNFRFISFAPDNFNYGWIVIDHDIYYTQDAGQTWQVQFSPDYRAIYLDLFTVNRDFVYIVGFSGLIMRTQNGGDLWENISLADTLHFMDAYFVDEMNGWICGNNGIILSTTDGGDSWTPHSVAQDVDLISVYFVDRLNGWIVGREGSVYQTKDGGEHWIKKNIDSDATLTKVYFVNKHKGFILGYSYNDGILLKTENSGQTWEMVSLPGTKLLADIDFADSTHGAIVGLNGTFMLTKDGGEEWLLGDEKTIEHFNHVDFLPDHTLWVSGGDIFMTSSDFGLHWEHKADDYIEWRMNNIIAKKEGKVSPDKTYVLCAHYDSISEFDKRETRAPGADDNASGTAAVLEAARVLSSAELNYTIKFVLFAAEEVGRVGSRYHANSALLRDEDILGVINLDMIAHDSNHDGEIEIHARDINQSQSLGSFVKKNISNLSLQLIPDYYPTEGRTSSDHQSLWNSGYSAIYLIEDHDDFSPGYHTIFDLVSDFNLSYYLDVSRLAIVSIAELADLTYPVLVQTEKIKPETLTLSEAYPNPFNQNTSVSFTLRRPLKINLSVFNVSGQLVETLTEGQYNAGSYDFYWDSGQYGTGIYFIRMQSPSNSLVKKCLLVK